MKKLFVGLVATAGIVAACSNDNTTTTPAVVASVTMVPAFDTALGGDTALVLAKRQLFAVLKDAGGKVLSVIQTGQAVTWTSSAPAVTTVDQSGKVRGHTLGSATITASIEGQSGTTGLTVDSLVVVTAVHVTPTPDSVLVDSTVSLRAVALDAAGDTLRAAFTIWTSSDTSVAKVTNADTSAATLGVAPGNTAAIQGFKAGTVTITAKVVGVTGTGSMKVKP